MSLHTPFPLQVFRRCRTRSLLAMQEACRCWSCSHPLCSRASLSGIGDVDQYIVTTELGYPHTHRSVCLCLLYAYISLILCGCVCMGVYPMCVTCTCLCFCGGQRSMPGVSLLSTLLLREKVSEFGAQQLARLPAPALPALVTDPPPHV